MPCHVGPACCGSCQLPSGLAVLEHRQNSQQGGDVGQRDTHWAAYGLIPTPKLGWSGMDIPLIQVFALILLPENCWGTPKHHLGDNLCLPDKGQNTVYWDLKPVLQLWGHEPAGTLSAENREQGWDFLSRARVVPHDWITLFSHHRAPGMQGMNSLHSLHFPGPPGLTNVGT